MFDKHDFDIFNVLTVDGRLKKIREDFDPKLEKYGNELISINQKLFDDSLYLYLAKHARRYKNPPVDTWLAISQNKRGYKGHPHIEMGIWEDRFFQNISFLSEIKNREIIVKRLREIDLNNQKLFISKDHTTSSMEKLTNENFFKITDRYLNVKNADIVIGKYYLKEELTKDFNSILLRDSEKLFNILKVFEEK